MSVPPIISFQKMKSSINECPITTNLNQSIRPGRLLQSYILSKAIFHHSNKKPEATKSQSSNQKGSDSKNRMILIPKIAIHCSNNYPRRKA